MLGFLHQDKQKSTNSFNLSYFVCFTFFDPNSKQFKNNVLFPITFNQFILNNMDLWQKTEHFQLTNSIDGEFSLDVRIWIFFDRQNYKLHILSQKSLLDGVQYSLKNRIKNYFSKQQLLPCIKYYYIHKKSHILCFFNFLHHQGMYYNNCQIKNIVLQYEKINNGQNYDTIDHMLSIIHNIKKINDKKLLKRNCKKSNKKNKVLL